MNTKFKERLLKTVEEIRDLLKSEENENNSQYTIEALDAKLNLHHKPGGGHCTQYGLYTRIFVGDSGECYDLKDQLEETN